MASKPETVLYSGINKWLNAAVHREKMNNPYRGGAADFWYSGKCGDLWVEYKWLPRSPRSAFNLTTGKKSALSGLQQKWLRERSDEGRNVAVIVGCPTGVMILRNQTWACDIEPNFVISRQQAADWIAKETYNAIQNKNAGNSS